MSNKILVQTQNFFVDTAKPAIGECRNATFVLPQGLMDCADHQDMTLVLNSFSMAKNWYRVNQLNNVFYIVGLSKGGKPDRTVDSVRVELTPGDYQFFEPNAFLTPAQFSKSLGNQLEFQIQRSLQVAHNTGVKSFKTTVSFNALTKRYVVDINTSAFHDPYANGMKLVCFTINASVPIDQGSIIDSILNTPTVQADERVYGTGVSTDLPLTVPAPATDLWQIDFNKFVIPGKIVKQGDVITWNVGDKYYHSSIVTAEPNFQGQNTIRLQLSISSFGTGVAPTAAELPVGTEVDFHKLLTDDAVDVHPGSTERAVNFAVSGTAALIINNDYPGYFAGDNNNIFHGYQLRNTIDGTGATFTTTLFADKTWFPNAGTDAGDVPIPTPILFAEISGANPQTIASGTALTVFQEVEMTFATANTMTVKDTTANIYFFTNASLGEGPGFTGSPGSLGQTITSVEYTANLITLTLSGNHNQTGTDGFIEFRSTNNIDPTFLQKYGKVFLQPTVRADSLLGHTLSWTGMPTNAEHPSVITQADGYPVGGVNQATILTTNFWDPDNVTDRSRWVQISNGSTVLSRGRDVVGGVNRSLNQFQSTWEVLGGCYEDRGAAAGTDSTDQFESLRPMFPMTSDGTQGTSKFFFGFSAPFNACLQPEENIYLRTNLNNANFQTPGFDTGTQTNVAQSQILAKIPLMNPTFAGVYEYTFNTADPPVAGVSSVYQYERPYEIIYYSDNGNNKYSIMMSQKRTTQIRLFVTDKYGRLIPEMSAEQINCGALSFAASLRIDIHERM